MNTRALLALTLSCAALLAGCASSQGNPATASALTARGVGPSTVVKVENGQHLDYDDILNMVQEGVPAKIIIGYLESTGSVYNFGPVQLQSLKEQGASPQLINCLLETQGLYGSRSGSAPFGQMLGSQNRPYYNIPLYQDQQPFAYNEPHHRQAL